MQNRPSRSRTLEVQQLESREMMAGNVTVDFDPQDDKDVVINGDNLGNSIEVRTFGNAVRVTGRYHDGAPTTINGSTSPVYYTLQDDLRINMSGGNDRVDAQYLYVDDLSHSDLTINLGQGHDDLYMYNVDVARNLNIDAGTENDDLDLLLVDVGNDLTARGGQGHDDINLHSVTADDVFVHGDHDKDDVYLSNVEATDELMVDLGFGDDQLWLYSNDAGRPKFSGGSGADHMYYSHSYSLKNDFDAWRWGNSFEYKHT